MEGSGFKGQGAVLARRKFLPWAKRPSIAMEGVFRRHQIPGSCTSTARWVRETRQPQQAAVCSTAPYEDSVVVFELGKSNSVKYRSPQPSGPADFHAAFSTAGDFAAEGQEMLLPTNVGGSAAAGKSMERT